MTNRFMSVGSRSARLAAEVSLVLPGIVAMDHDPERRRNVGRRLAVMAQRLGGLYPWLCYQLGALPGITGVDVATGIRERWDIGPVPDGLPALPSSTVHGDGPLFSRIRSPELPPGQSLLVEIRVDQDLLTTDLIVFDGAVRLLTPVTGPVSGELIKELQLLLRAQLEAESSLKEEMSERRAFPNGYRLRPAGGVDDSSFGGVLEPDLPTVEAGASPAQRYRVLLHLIEEWTKLVMETGFVPAYVTWDTVSRAEGDTLIIRRLAGSARLQPHLIDLVQGLMSSANYDEAATDPRVKAALGVELDVPEGAVQGLMNALAAIIYPVGGRAPGPLATLRLLDAVTRASGAARFTPELFVLLRQLALFRSMTDEFGSENPLFAQKQLD